MIFSLLGPHTLSGVLNVKVGAVLLEKVINHSSDHDIWCAVYDFVSPPTFTINSVTDTQHVFNYPSESLNLGGS
jgi:hypothetical protein